MSTLPQPATARLRAPQCLAALHQWARTSDLGTSSCPLNSSTGRALAAHHLVTALWRRPPGSLIFCKYRALACVAGSMRCSPSLQITKSDSHLADRNLHVHAHNDIKISQTTFCYVTIRFVTGWSENSPAK